MDLTLSTTALLTLDYQHGILGQHPGANAAVQRAAQVAQAARSKGLWLVHVGLGFAAGHPEVAATNPVFAKMKANNAFCIGGPEARFHPDLVQPGEPIVYKHRFSAFAENQLALVLRARGVTHLVLMGVSTGGIVLSTLRRAFDLDFCCTVVHDACFDADEQVHRVLCEKVFTRQAAVVSSQQLCAALAAH